MTDSNGTDGRDSIDLDSVRGTGQGSDSESTENVTGVSEVHGQPEEVNATPLDEMPEEPFQVEPLSETGEMVQVFDIQRAPQEMAPGVSPSRLRPSEEALATAAPRDAPPIDLGPSEEAPATAAPGDAPPIDLGTSDPVAAEPEAHPKIKPSDIGTMTDLLSFAYQQDGKRMPISAVTFKAIDAAVLSESGWTEGERYAKRRVEVSLAEGLATHDPLLAVPPRLLGEIMEQSDGAATKKRLGEIVATVLRGNAAFDVDIVRSALISTPADRDAPFVALKARIARLSDGTIGSTAALTSPKDREKLASNAVVSLALLLGNRDRWTTEELIECFSRHLWAGSAQAVQRPRSVLAGSKSPEALHLVINAFYRKIARTESIANEALVEVDSERHRAQRAEALVEERDDLLAEQARAIQILEIHNTDLVKEIRASERQIEIDRSHHVSDYEEQRTRIVRMLEQQSKLLVDGLHALQNGSPSVTEEYLERTLSAFKREMDQLAERRRSI